MARIDPEVHYDLPEPDAPYLEVLDRDPDPPRVILGPDGTVLRRVWPAPRIGFRRR